MKKNDLVLLLFLGALCVMWIYRPSGALLLMDDEVVIVPPTILILIPDFPSPPSPLPPPPPSPPSVPLSPSSPPSVVMKPENTSTPQKWNYGCHGGLPRINFPLSVTTRNLKLKGRPVLQYQQLPLVQYFLTSVINSMEPSKFDYSIYVGVDNDDPWLTNASHVRDIQRWWDIRYRYKWGKGTCVPPLEFFAYDNTRSRNVWAVNYVSQVAYDRGYDCFYRVNDDTVLMEDQWSSKFFAEMAQFKPIPFLGVVGPTDLQHAGLLTHSMICRPHFMAMGVHFNYYFGNWWSDPWIQKLYEGPYPEAWGGKEVRMFRRFVDVKVKHMLVKNRYDVQGDEGTYLKVLAIDRNGTLDRFIVKYLEKENKSPA
jgi:hypothetical protein